MSTGRFIVEDAKTGRKFLVEVLADRSQKVDDKTWTNGGIQDVKGGCIREEDSIIPKVCIDWEDLPPGTSPFAAIEAKLREP